MDNEYLSQSSLAKSTTFEEPLIASFWRDGQFLKMKCIDCVVNSGPNYTEIMIRSEDDTNSMFLITADPEISAAMNDRIFDGFQLRNASGSIIEQITRDDSTTRH